MPGRLAFAQTETLDVAYEVSGAEGGDVDVLMHGFPYDPRCFDAVVPILVEEGHRVVVPYLRGFGPTRFRSADTPRSGQQGAIGQDLLDLLDALDINTAVLAGFDWGGRAASIVAATQPERVTALVTASYGIQAIAHASDPKAPAQESADWYQHYFQHEAGRRALVERRDELIQYLWQTWSPTWRDASQLYPATSPSFRNPDFVDVVIHSYRHRWGQSAGAEMYAELEDALALQPPISVPSVVLQPDADSVERTAPNASATDKFVGATELQILHGVGHNIPRESPQAFAAAVLRARAMAAGSAKP